MNRTNTIKSLFDKRSNREDFKNIKKLFNTLLAVYNVTNKNIPKYNSLILFCNRINMLTTNLNKIFIDDWNYKIKYYNKNSFYLYIYLIKDEITISIEDNERTLNGNHTIYDTIIKITIFLEFEEDEILRPYIEYFHINRYKISPTEYLNNFIHPHCNPNGYDFGDFRYTCLGDSKINKILKDYLISDDIDSSYFAIDSLLHHLSVQSNSGSPYFNINKLNNKIAYKLPSNSDIFNTLLLFLKSSYVNLSFNKYEDNINSLKVIPYSFIEDFKIFCFDNNLEEFLCIKENTNYFKLQKSSFNEVVKVITDISDFKLSDKRILKFTVIDDRINKDTDYNIEDLSLSNKLIDTLSININYLINKYR